MTDDKPQPETKAQKREREDYATTRAREREDLLASITYPKRGSKELSETRRAAKGMLPLLHAYDSSAEPPAVADATQALFEELVARIQELCTLASKSE